MATEPEYVICTVVCYHPASARFVAEGTVGRVTGVGGTRICVDGVWWERSHWEPSGAFAFARWREEHPGSTRTPFLPGLVIVDDGAEVPVEGHEIVGAHAVAL